MSLHHEIASEREICEHSGAHGWLQEEGSAAGYSRELALYPPDLIAWVQEAQPEAWEVLQKNHGSQAEATLLQRLRHPPPWGRFAGGSSHQHGRFRAERQGQGQLPQRQQLQLLVVQSLCLLQLQA